MATLDVPCARSEERLELLASRCGGMRVAQRAQVMVRGLRSGTDFDYEFQLAGMNKHLLPQAEQARKAIWDAVNPHTGKRFAFFAEPKAVDAVLPDGRHRHGRSP